MFTRHKKTRFSRQLVNSFLSYFIRGMLLTMPLALTGYIISLALKWVGSIIKIKIPGLGMAIVLVSITLLGYLGSTLLIGSLFDSIEKIVIKLPLINTI